MSLTFFNKNTGNKFYLLTFIVLFAILYYIIINFKEEFYGKLCRFLSS